MGIFFHFRLQISGGLCRQGVGKCMLEACDFASKKLAPHLDLIYLHVESNNSMGYSLYVQGGFVTEKVSTSSSWLRFRVPEKLMVKDLKLRESVESSASLS
jgi:hypothetical protein